MEWERHSSYVHGERCLGSRAFLQLEKADPYRALRTTCRQLPPLDNYIDVPGIQLEEPRSPPCPLGSDHCRAGSTEGVEHDVSAL